MNDSGLPPSNSVDPAQENIVIYEPGGQVFIPDNTEGNNVTASTREAVTDGLSVQQDPPYQSPAAQLNSPYARMGSQQSHMGESMETELPCSVQGEQYPAMQLQQTGTPVDPVSKWCPDNTSEENVQEGLYLMHPDANFNLRGIPEGDATEDDPEETRLKTVIPHNQPEERNQLQMPPPQIQVTDCTQCIGFLLDNAGVKDRTIRQKKEQIIVNMQPRSSPFSSKTVIGLVEVTLPNLIHEQIQAICSQPQQDPHRTCVHILLAEMKAEGRRLAHLVDYFWARESKRVDILKLVRDIHQGCPFCGIIFQQLP